MSISDVCVEKTFSGSGDLGYILILNPNVQDVRVTNLTVKYTCGHEIDNNFFYTPDVNYYTGARSWGANRKMNHNYIEFITDPKPDNNNYSTGQTNPHVYTDSWYRWNGVSLRNYQKNGETLVYDEVPFGNFTSNSFEVITSVIVEPRVFYDETAWFHAAPWVAIDDEERLHPSDPFYMQSHIGIDNYDPKGGVHTRTDTYRGRFYTNWAENGGGYSYGFVDPEVATVVDSAMTLKEAYEATNLPFFHVRFEVIENSYAVYINGFKVQYVEDAFYKTYEGQKYSINNIALHGVNYGLQDGTAGDASSEYNPYRLTYLNPIVREIPAVNP